MRRPASRRRHYRAIWPAVCVCGDRASQPPTDPLQPHSAPESRLDAATLREAVGCEDGYKFLIHDRDSIVCRG